MRLDISKSKQYNCIVKHVKPPKDFIHFNFVSDYEKDKFKNDIVIDSCLEEELNELWSKGIHTMGCCCGHGINIGFIQVEQQDVDRMYDLGYQQYIYEDNCGGLERKDAFIPKTYLHNINTEDMFSNTNINTYMESRR